MELPRFSSLNRGFVFAGALLQPMGTRLGRQLVAAQREIPRPPFRASSQLSALWEAVRLGSTVTRLCNPPAGTPAMRDTLVSRISYRCPAPALCLLRRHEKSRSAYCRAAF